MDIVTLSPDIFDGLYAMTWLELNNNQIRVLPEFIFSNLTSLRGLAINWNALEHIPAHLFRPLHALEHLELRGNRISSMEAGSLDGLVNLKRLYLVSLTLPCPSFVLDQLHDSLESTGSVLTA